jgi:hypothetical protein
MGGNVSDSAVYLKNSQTTAISRKNVKKLFADRISFVMTFTSNWEEFNAANCNRSKELNFHSFRIGH